MEGLDGITLSYVWLEGRRREGKIIRMFITWMLQKLKILFR
jgi:hypothetical protein